MEENVTYMSRFGLKQHRFFYINFIQKNNKKFNKLILKFGLICAIFVFFLENGGNNCAKLIIASKNDFFCLFGITN